MAGRQRMIVTAAVAIAVATGYFVLGRGFSHLGLGPLFLGEAILIGALLHPRSRRVLHSALSDLGRPSPFHVLTWTIALMIGYGIFQVGYGIQQGYPTLVVLQTSAFSFYVLFLLLGIRISQAHPLVLERLDAYVPV